MDRRLTVLRRGEPLPPVEVYGAASTTFLGGNRVAAARAVGRDFISARVIKGGLGCRFEGRIKP
jgi:hypothetical protein